MRDRHVPGARVEPVTPAGFTRRQAAFIVTATLVVLVVLFAYLGAIAAAVFVLGMLLGLVYGVPTGAHLHAHDAQAGGDAPDA